MTATPHADLAGQNVLARLNANYLCPKRPAAVTAFREQADHEYIAPTVKQR